MHTRVLTGFFLILFLFQPVSLFSEEPDSEPSGVCDFPEKIKYTRPDLDEVPTKVNVAVALNDLTKVDVVNGNFTADFFIHLRWKDYRVGKIVRDAGLKSCQVSLDDIWNPTVLITNEQELHKPYSDMITVDSEGEVIYAQRYFGKLSEHYSLKSFPLDQHELNIILASYYPASEVILEKFEEFSGMRSDLHIENWEVGKESYRTEKRLSELDRKFHSRFLFQLDVYRQFGYYFWKVLTPLAMIVFMSWTVFWISPQYRVSQLALSATSYLTLIAYQLALSNSLPKIAYLTRLDIIIMGSTILVFLALVETVATTVLVHNEKNKIAHNLDAWSRILFPACFILFIFGAFYF